MQHYIIERLERGGRSLAALILGLAALAWPFSAVAQTVTWDVGTLGASGTATLTIQVTVDEGAIVDNDIDPDADVTDGAETTNTANITNVDQTDTNNANDTSSAEVAIDTAITLLVDKTADVDGDATNDPDAGSSAEATGVTVNEGDTIDYTITITHPGSGAPQLDTLTILDTVAGTALASAPTGLTITTTDVGTADPLDITSQTGDIFTAPGLVIGDATNPLNFDDGDVITITYSQTIAAGTAGSQVDNIFSATDTDDEIDFTASTYQYDMIVDGTVDLALDKEATGLTDNPLPIATQPGDDNDVAEGQTIEFTIVVTHNGDGSGNPGAQMDDFTVTDVIDTAVLQNLNITSVVSSTAGALTAGTEYVDNSTASTIDMQFNGITLDQGDTITITYEVDVQTGLAVPLSFTNSATTTINNTNLTDADNTNDSDIVQLDVLGLDLEVLKTADVSVQDEGGTITYTITITNNGSLPATSVELQDILPAGVTVVNPTDCTVSQGTVSGGGC